MTVSNKMNQTTSFRRRLFFYDFLVGFGLLFPAILFLISTISNFNIEATPLFFAISYGVALTASLLFYTITMYYIQPLTKGVGSGFEKLTPKEIGQAVYRFAFLIKLPEVMEAARWLITSIVIIALFSLLHPLSHIELINLSLLLFIHLLIRAMVAFFFMDFWFSKIFSSGLDLKERVIRTRLSWSLSRLVILSSTTGIFIVATISANAYYRSLEKSYTNQLQNIAEVLDREIEGFLDARSADARYLASLPLLKREIHRGDYTETNTLLTNLSREYKVYENIFIVNPGTKTVQAAVVKPSIGFRFGARPNDDMNIVNMPQSGKSYFSEGIQSPVTGRVVALMSEPIKEGNQVIGVLGLALELGTALDRFISPVKIGHSGYSAILDSSLKVLAHPDKKLMLKDLSGLDFVQQMKNGGDSGTIRYMWDGAPKLLVFRRNLKYGYYSMVTLYYTDIDDDFKYIEILFILSALAIVTVSGVLLYYAITKKLNPLAISEQLIRKLSEGNLKQEIAVTSFDEVGRVSVSLQDFVTHLTGSMGEIQGVAGELMSAAKESSMAAANLSESASSQAASIEEVASAIVEVQGQVDSIAHNAADHFKRVSDFIHQIEELSRSTVVVAEKQKEIILLSRDIAVVAKSGETSLNEMSDSMKRINESSMKMTSIVDIISEISEKINLLSLNASIEAARAGEAGRGFAVVANEVSKLAEQTASSIKEIDTLIRVNNEEIDQGKEHVLITISAIGKIMGGINTISDQLSILEKSMKLQLQTNENVTHNANEMNTGIRRMRGSTEEQRLAMNEITASIENINALTQTNAAEAEEIAATSESLSHFVERLDQALSYYKIQ